MFKNRFFLLFALVFMLVFPASTQDEAEAPLLRVGGFGTRMQEGTSADYVSIASLATGVEVSILGFNESANYYLVVFDGELGWIGGANMLISGNLEHMPVLRYESLEEIPQLAFDDVVTLHQLPDAESEVIAEVEDASFYILAIDELETFLFVVYEGQSAWLSIEALADENELDLSDLAIIGGEVAIEPCMISTEQAQTVRVRVGFGENRTSVTFLEANTEFEVFGYNTDANDVIWYALNKELAAPGKSIAGDFVWIPAESVDSSGDCESIPLIDNSFMHDFLPPAPPATNENSPDNSPAEEAPAPVARGSGTINLLLDPNIMPCPITQLYGVSFWISIGSGHSSQDAAQAALNAQSTSISINGQPMPVTRDAVSQVSSAFYNFSTDYFWSRPLPGVYDIVGTEPNATRTCTVIIEG